MMYSTDTPECPACGYEPDPSFGGKFACRNTDCRVVKYHSPKVVSYV